MVVCKDVPFFYINLFFFSHCLQWMKKKQQKESLSTSMVEEGSLNRGLPHSANDTLASLLTFCSHFLFTKLSCRISLPAFSLRVPLLVIASPSHFGKVLEVTYANLGSPLCPPSWTLVCNHFCLASSLLVIHTFIHTHPKIQQLGIKLAAVVVVGCWVGRLENGAAGWEHQTVSSAPGTKGCLPSCQFWQVKI